MSSYIIHLMLYLIRDGEWCSFYSGDWCALPYSLSQTTQHQVGLECYSHFLSFHLGTGTSSAAQERQQREAPLQLPPGHPYPSPQERSDFPGESGERPWPAGLCPKGGTYSGPLAAWTFPRMPPFLLPGRGPAWSSCLHWEEDMESSGLDVSIRSEFSKGRGLLYMSPSP